MEAERASPLSVALLLHRDLVASILRQPRPREEGKTVPPSRDNAYLPLLIMAMLTLPVEILLFFVLIPGQLWWLRDLLLLASVEATLLVWGVYASLGRRPHLLTERGLLVRWSYFTEALLPYEVISRAEPRRDRNPSGQFGVTFHPAKPEAFVTNGLATNLTIDLAHPIKLSGLLVGSREVTRVHLAVLRPDEVAGALSERRSAELPPAESGDPAADSSPPPTTQTGLSTRTLVLLTVAMELPLFAIGYVWMVGQGLDPIAELRPTVDGLLLGAALGASIAAISLGSLALSKRVAALSGWASFVEGTLGQYLGPASLSALALLSVSAGLGEEVFFRGALQGSVGLVPTAIVFGIAHVGIPKREMLPYLAYTVLVGLVFGYVRLGQPLFPLVVAHALVDLIDTAYLHFANARRGRT